MNIWYWSEIKKN